jgi:hypothetical protein
MNQLPRIGIAWLLLVAAQVLIFNAMSLGVYASAFPIVLLILMLPFDLPLAGIMLGAFFTGLAVDSLGDINGLGLQAFSLTLVAAVRGFWVPVVSSSVYRSLEEIDLNRQRLSWYAAYTFPLILLHHIAYFLLDSRGVNMGKALLQALGSSVYTFVICFLLIVIFYRKQ